MPLASRTGGSVGTSKQGCATETRPRAPSLHAAPAAGYGETPTLRICEVADRSWACQLNSARAPTQIVVFASLKIRCRSCHANGTRVCRTETCVHSVCKCVLNGATHVSNTRDCSPSTRDCTRYCCSNAAPNCPLSPHQARVLGGQVLSTLLVILVGQV